MGELSSSLVVVRKIPEKKAYIWNFTFVEICKCETAGVMLWYYLCICSFSDSTLLSLNYVRTIPYLMSKVGGAGHEEQDQESPPLEDAHDE